MPDAGRPMPDAGRRMPDAGRPMPDAGRPMPDAGRPMPDAGRRLPDAGRPMPDAGRRLPDAGRRQPDAGQRQHEQHQEDAYRSWPRRRGRGRVRSRSSSRTSGRRPTSSGGSPVDRTDWKSYILPLLFFKRVCDVWDEEHAAMLTEYGAAARSEGRERSPGTRGHGSARMGVRGMRGAGRQYPRNRGIGARQHYLRNTG